MPMYSNDPRLIPIAPNSIPYTQWSRQELLDYARFLEQKIQQCKSMQHQHHHQPQPLPPTPPPTRPDKWRVVDGDGTPKPPPWYQEETECTNIIKKFGPYIIRGKITSLEVLKNKKTGQSKARVTVSGSGMTNPDANTAESKESTKTKDSAGNIWNKPNIWHYKPPGWDVAGTLPKRDATLTIETPLEIGPPYYFIPAYKLLQKENEYYNLDYYFYAYYNCNNVLKEIKLESIRYVPIHKWDLDETGKPRDNGLQPRRWYPYYEFDQEGGNLPPTKGGLDPIDYAQTQRDTVVAEALLSAQKNNKETEYYLWKEVDNLLKKSIDIDIQFLENSQKNK